MMHFHTVDRGAGTGKTFHATNYICEHVSAGYRGAILQPTVRLSQASLADARERWSHLHPRIRGISEAGAVKRLVEYLTLAGESDKGRLLFSTHQAFERLHEWPMAEHWHLFIDEAFETTYFQVFKLRDHRHLIDDLFVARPFNDQYSRLEAVDHSRLLAVRDILARGDDDIHEYFASLSMKLLSSHWQLFVENDHFARFRAGEVHRLEVHGLLSPAVFKKFASVTLMSANLTASFMYHHFKAQGCTFAEHKAITRRLRSQSHANGDRLVIRYLSERPWSKTLRDTEIHLGENGERITVGKHYLELCERAVANIPRARRLWIANKDVKDHAFVGNRLPNVPHGANDYQDALACCVLSALNPVRSHVQFLQAMCGMSERDVRRALLSQTAYQALGRGCLRDPESTDIFVLIVPDRDTAADVAACYPGCRVERLQADYPLPLDGRGRPATHPTSEDRKAADVRKATRSRQRRRWKDELVQAITALPVPLFTKSSLFYSDFGKQPAPDAANAAGFFLSLWQRKYDFRPYYQGHLTPAALAADLHRRQTEFVYASKEANWLMAPAFYDFKAEPERGHTITNVAALKGVVLDLDHTSVTPDAFAATFPEVEMILASSYSNAPGDLRYRVFIPTATAMTRVASHAIRLMIASRIGGRQAGVDMGKLHAAALFYLPSRTEHRFFHHHTAGRQPLDPVAWIEACPPEIVDVYLEPNEPVCQPRPDTLKERGRAIDRAIRYWQAFGLAQGEGRKQLWFLAIRLGQAGCALNEMRQILWEQAGHAHNPSERRTEVEALLRDPKVKAAMTA